MVEDPVQWHTPDTPKSGDDERNDIFSCHVGFFYFTLFDRMSSAASGDACSETFFCRPFKVSFHVIKKIEKKSLHVVWCGDIFIRSVLICHPIERLG